MRLTFPVLLALLPIAGCSQGPGDRSDSPASASSRLGGDAGIPGFDAAIPGLPGLPGFDAGACAPTVTASPSSCSITIDGTTCDCTDEACVESAAVACLGVDASVPSLPSPGFGAGCTQSDIDAAKKQFCSDVDAALKAQGIGFALDCAAIGQLPTSFAPPASPPSGPSCGDFTQAAAANAQQALAVCPAAAIAWDPTARLQIFDDGDCMLP